VFFSSFSVTSFKTPHDLHMAAWVTGLQAGQSGNRFCLLQNVRTGSGVHTPSYSVDSLTGIKQPGLE
jgi:hypothetical protein